MVDINKDKMSLSDVIDIELFREIVGANAMRNVVIATSKWSNLVSGKVGEQRVQQLSSEKNFFGELLQGGASMAHLKQTEDYPKIVETILKGNKPALLRLQEEVVDEKKTLIETAAGSVIGRDLNRRNQEIENRLGKLKQQDEQNRPTKYNVDDARDTSHHPIDIVRRDQTEQARLNRQARIQDYEQVKMQLEEALARMNRNGEQIRKIAAKLTIFGVAVAVAAVAAEAGVVVVAVVATGLAVATAAPLVLTGMAAGGIAAVARSLF
jgi:hypothetical protein